MNFGGLQSTTMDHENSAMYSKSQAEKTAIKAAAWPLLVKKASFPVFRKVKRKSRGELVESTSQMVGIQ